MDSEVGSYLQSPFNVQMVEIKAFSSFSFKGLCPTYLDKRDL